MAYAVKLSQRAERDLFELFLYLDGSDSSAARRWFNGLEKAIYRLGRFPVRCQIAPESQKLGRTVRQLLYGNRPSIYRVLYEVHDSTKTVLVLVVRHGARDEWNPERQT